MNSRTALAPRTENNAPICVTGAATPAVPATFNYSGGNSDGVGGIEDGDDDDDLANLDIDAVIQAEAGRTAKRPRT